MAMGVKEASLFELAPVGRRMPSLAAAAAGAIVYCALSTIGCGGDARERVQSVRATDAGTDGRDANVGGADATACTQARRDYESQVATTAVSAGVPCFTGRVDFGTDTGTRADSYYYAKGYDKELAVTACSDDSPAAAAVEQQVETALAALDLPCLAAGGESLSFFDGGTAVEAEEIIGAIDLARCAHEYGLRFVLDEAGAVVEVTGPDVDPETLDCVSVAMQGLFLPCLAGSEVCSQHAMYDY
jgi:hypothetical protein